MSKVKTLFIQKFKSFAKGFKKIFSKRCHQQTSIILSCSNWELVEDHVEDQHQSQEIVVLSSESPKSNQFQDIIATTQQKQQEFDSQHQQIEQNWRCDDKAEQVCYDRATLDDLTTTGLFDNLLTDSEKIIRLFRRNDEDDDDYKSFEEVPFVSGRIPSCEFLQEAKFDFLEYYYGEINYPRYKGNCNRISARRRQPNLCFETPFYISLHA